MAGALKTVFGLTFTMVPVLTSTVLKYTAVGADVAEQPLASETVTVYMADWDDTVMEDDVDPSLQRYVVPGVDVRVTDPPTQRFVEPLC
jgi:hypothetical protein